LPPLEFCFGTSPIQAEKSLELATQDGIALRIEPSVRTYSLWERDNAFTDSLGTAQPVNAFSESRVSTGGKASYPLQASSNISVVPCVGLYTDYRFDFQCAAGRHPLCRGRQRLVGAGDDGRNDSGAFRDLRCHPREIIDASNIR
jgi:hypothetical protein